MLENKVITTDSKQAQKDALDKVLKEELTQGKALRNLLRFHNEYEEFNLSDVQRIMLEHQDKFFHCIKAVYTKSQLEKVEQIDRIKRLESGQEIDLITRDNFAVYYVPNSKEPDKKYYQGSFGTKEKAEEFCKELPLQNLEIEHSETPISTKFTPKEMLNRLQYIEGKFWKTFENAKAVTPAMVKRAIGADVTETDKKFSKQMEKQEIQKAA